MGEYWLIGPAPLKAPTGGDLMGAGGRARTEPVGLMLLPALEGKSRELGIVLEPGLWLGAGRGALKDVSGPCRGLDRDRDLEPGSGCRPFPNPAGSVVPSLRSRR